MKKVNKSILSALATIAILGCGVASAFSCGQAIVQTGDTELEVNSKCGQPINSNFVVISPWGVAKKSTYDIGQGKFYQILIFKDDKLVNIQNGSRH
ncbi:DUF2845 domain-containing protein [uncultured Lamprocystis sp.]|jgi:hypothetical protein|uniref:DUF2845 domain-containing protein n=1 Tax=uncultured Lamprocystis sp. TaxID=543132 RepID=UPI0025D62F21|nr:DUF2845 domain-containing protein [uncultured Lamprocystis sp.]